MRLGDPWPSPILGRKNHLKDIYLPFPERSEASVSLSAQCEHSHPTHHLMLFMCSTEKKKMSVSVKDIDSSVYK